MQKNLFCCLASASSNFVMTFGLRCAPRFSWGCCTIGFGHSTRWCAGSSPPPPIFGPPATDVLRFGRGRSAAAGFETRVSRAQGPLPTPAENQPVGPYVSALDKEPGSCGPNTRHNDFTTSLARSFFFHLILCVRARPLRPLNFQPQKFSHVTKRVTAGPLRVFFREKKNILTSNSFDVSLYPKR